MSGLTTWPQPHYHQILPCQVTPQKNLWWIKSGCRANSWSFRLADSLAQFPRPKEVKLEFMLRPSLSIIWWQNQKRQIDVVRSEWSYSRHSVHVYTIESNRISGALPRGICWANVYSACDYDDLVFSEIVNRKAIHAGTCKFYPATPKCGAQWTPTCTKNIWSRSCMSAVGSQIIHHLSSEGNPNRLLQQPVHYSSKTSKNCLRRRTHFYHVVLRSIGIVAK